MHDQPDHHDRGNHDDNGDHEEVGSYMRKLEVVHKVVGGCLISYNLRLACVRKLEVIWPDAPPLPRRSFWMMNHESTVTHSLTQLPMWYRAALAAKNTKNKTQLKNLSTYHRRGWAEVQGPVQHHPVDTHARWSRKTNWSTRKPVGRTPHSIEGTRVWKPARDDKDSRCRRTGTHVGKHLGGADVGHWYGTIRTIS